jgi:hypothetical protein
MQVKMPVGSSTTVMQIPYPDMLSFLDRNGYITDAGIDIFLEKDINCSEANARILFTQLRHIYSE